MDDGANIEPTPVAPTAFAFFHLHFFSWVQQYTIFSQKPYVMTVREVSIIYTGGMVI